jgi:glycosyltransferase involved in cell wall biosynthesis
MAGPGAAIAEWMRGAPVERFVHSANFPSWEPARGLALLAAPMRYVRCGARARDEMSQLVEQERIDVILASLPFAWITGTLVARQAGIPIAWRAGGSHINDFQRLGLRLLSAGMRPDLLICNAEAVRDTFEPWIPAPVAIVPNGIDQHVFFPGAGNRALFRPADARLVVGYAGRLAPAKHPEDVVELAARLQESFPDVRLLVAGEGSGHAEYEQMARTRGIHNLTFLGFVSDMPSFYAACDVIVLPSGSEGCSNVLLEAMVSRKVVVAAAIPPVVELIENREHGLTFALGDEDGLTQAVTELLQSPELRENLADNARKRALSFTAEASAAQLSTLLRDLVAARATRPSRAPEPAPSPGSSAPACLPVGARSSTVRQSTPWSGRLGRG